MKFTHFQSGAVMNIIYRARKLRVTFSSGKILEYKKVPQNIYTDFTVTKDTVEYYLRFVRHQFKMRQVNE